MIDRGETMPHYRDGRLRSLPDAGEVEAARKAVEGAVREFDQALRPAGAEFVANLLGALSVAYPASKLSADEAELQLEIYAAMLGPVPLDLIAEAARCALRGRTFFPSVAELYEPIRGRWLQRVADRNRLAALLDMPPLQSPECGRGDMVAEHLREMKYSVLEGLTC